MAKLIPLWSQVSLTSSDSVHGLLSQISGHIHAKSRDIPGNSLDFVYLKYKHPINTFAYTCSVSFDLNLNIILLQPNLSWPDAQSVIVSAGAVRCSKFTVSRTSSPNFNL
jgi:hypothetical protein